MQGLNELPLLKSGEIEIPKRWHMNNDSLHLLDVFRDWRCPPGLRLLMGLLKYDPLLRLSAEKALTADYFTTLVGLTPASLLWSHVPVYISRVARIISFQKSRYLFLFFSIEKSLRQLHLVWCLRFPRSSISCPIDLFCHDGSGLRRRGMNTRAWVELWR